MSMALLLFHMGEFYVSVEAAKLVRSADKTTSKACNGCTLVSNSGIVRCHPGTLTLSGGGMPTSSNR